MSELLSLKNAVSILKQDNDLEIPDYSNIRHKELKMILDRIPLPPSPRADWEQYMTPGELVVELLGDIHATDSISDKDILDLGSGTGRFSLGALALGAGRVLGIERDEVLVDIAAAAATKSFGFPTMIIHPEGTDNQYSITETGGNLAFLIDNVVTLNPDDLGSFDMVIMNPPFGSQKKQADRPFLELAMTCAPVVYSLHMAGTKDFVGQLAEARGFDKEVIRRFSFPIRAIFAHHRKKVQRENVILVRYEKQ